MHLVRMPKVAENMTAGSVGPWRVAAGDRVNPGDPVVELVTEKAEFTLEAEVAGRVAALLAAERSTVPVGYVLAVLAEEGEEAAARSAAEAENAETLRRAAQEAPGGSAKSPAAAAPVAAAPEASGDARVRATPAARRLAREKGVALGEVAAALDLAGAVREEDVRRFLDAGGAP